MWKRGFARPNSSNAADAFKGHEIRRIHRRSSEIGAARNAAVREAKGEYLFFVDDHTLLLAPNAISIFVQVAQRVDADILTSAISFFWDPRTDRRKIASSTPAVRFWEAMPLPVLSSIASGAPMPSCGATPLKPSKDSATKQCQLSTTGSFFPKRS